MAWPSRARWIISSLRNGAAASASLYDCSASPLAPFRIAMSPKAILSSSSWTRASSRPVRRYSTEQPTRSASAFSTASEGALFPVSIRDT